MSVKISEPLSRQLAALTFVATLLVVMCHCDDVMIKQDGFVRFFGGIFTDANVANFFFLSGFFVARHFGEDRWYRSAIAGRLRTLGVPYLGWCIIYCGVFALAACLGFFQPPQGMFEFKNIFGIGLSTPPIDFALWYIKTLFYFILVAPLFFRLQTKYRLALPIIAMALLLLRISPFGNFPQSLYGFCFNLVGLICFLTGAQVAFSQTLLGVFFHAGKWIWGVCWLIFWFLVAIGVDCSRGTFRLILHPFYVLFAVFCLHRVVACVPLRIGEVLIKSSFMIYAVHLMILKLVSPCLNDVFGQVPMLCYSMLFIVSVTGGIVLTMFLRKTSPVVLSLLTGGRG